MVTNLDGNPSGTSYTNNWLSDPQLFNSDSAVGRDWAFTPTAAVQRISVERDWAYHNNTNRNAQSETVPTLSGRLFREVRYAETTTVFHVITDSPANVVPGENLFLELRTSWSTNGVDFVTEFNDMSFVQNLFIDGSNAFHGLPTNGTKQVDLWRFEWPQPTDGGGQPITNAFTVFYAPLIKTTLGTDPNEIETDFTYLLAEQSDTTPNNFPDDPQYFGQDFTGRDYGYAHAWDPTIDSDSDGLTDAQEATEGTNPFLSDTDEDGQTDFQEILAGTDPLNPSSFFLLEGAMFGASATHLTLQWTAVGSALYDIEAASVLTNGNFTFSVLESDISGSGLISTNLPLNGQNLRILRVIAKPAP